MNEIIINFTPTGMIPTKAMTPHVPVTVNEIIDDVLMAESLGITMVHLHARDPESGLPTYRSDIYGRIIEGIRKFSPKLVICVSLSGRTFSELEKRVEPLTLDGHLKPDMGSLTLSSVNFNRQASLNEPSMIMSLAEKMKERGIKPELESFDVGMINYAKYLERKGIISPPHYINLILGNISCAQADPLHVGLMLRDLPQHSVWSMGGVGEAQFPINSLAVVLGGGVRIGLEDNIWYDRNRTVLARNQDLLRRLHAIIEVNERTYMKPEQFRTLMRLNDGIQGYGTAHELIA